MNTRTAVASLLFVLAMLAIAGCYSSKVPLEDSPSAAVNKSWLGHWSAGDETRVVVYPFDEHQYVIDVINKDGEHALHRAFATAVAGETILSIRNLQSDQWCFARIRGEGDSLEMAMLRKDAIDATFESAADLRSAVEKIVDEPGAFADPFRLTRAED